MRTPSLVSDSYVMYYIIFVFSPVYLTKRKVFDRMFSLSRIGPTSGLGAQLLIKANPSLNRFRATRLELRLRRVVRNVTSLCFTGFFISTLQVRGTRPMIYCPALFVQIIDPTQKHSQTRIHSTPPVIEWCFGCVTPNASPFNGSKIPDAVGRNIWTIRVLAKFQWEFITSVNWGVIASY